MIEIDNKSSPTGDSSAPTSEMATDPERDQNAGLMSSAEPYIEGRTVNDSGESLISGPLRLSTEWPAESVTVISTLENVVFHDSNREKAGFLSPGESIFLSFLVTDSFPQAWELFEFHDDLLNLPSKLRSIVDELERLASIRD